MNLFFKRSKGMLKKICNFFSSLIFIILLLIALVMFVPNILGYKSFAVISGSMEPNIHVGSIVYAKEADFNDLRVDDIISYQLSSDTMVTHRIVSIDNEKQTVVTKGDTNDVEDSAPVSKENIIGKVAFSIPLLGYISLNVKTPLGILVICGIVAVLILLNFLPDVFEKEDEKED